METKPHKFRRLANVLEGFLEKEQFLIRKGQFEALIELMPKKGEVTDEVAKLWLEAKNCPDFPTAEDTERMENIIEGYKINESIITEALKTMRINRKSANKRIQRFRNFRLGNTPINTAGSEVNLSA